MLTYLSKLRPIVPPGNLMRKKQKINTVVCGMIAVMVSI